ncbi:peptidoglycan-binding protein [Mesorhizobium sp. M1312]|uniref:peptidoglycan-binding protein n=1 Tax=unclassified Mesorhizobium TaxID=325217 RepID=UPI0033362F02
MFPVDGNFILRVAPQFTGKKLEAQSAIVGAISPFFAAILDSYEINTRLRIAHFMGQVAHECAGFRTTEEFASGAAYENRSDLGNNKPGDGRRYKGRGLLQLTGRDNYRRMGESLHLELEDNPKLAADPVVSLKIACEYWKVRMINAPADNDNLVKVTMLVNGGLNGLKDRGNYLRKAKTLLAEMQGILRSAAEGGSTIVLRRGNNNNAVGELQELLRKMGFLVAVDNDFGPATETAVLSFQARAKIETDGIVGAKTWEALRA